MKTLLFAVSLLLTISSFAQSESENDLRGIQSSFKECQILFPGEKDVSGNKCLGREFAISHSGYILKTSKEGKVTSCYKSLKEASDVMRTRYSCEFSPVQGDYKILSTGINPMKDQIGNYCHHQYGVTYKNYLIGGDWCFSDLDKAMKAMHDLAGLSF